MTTRTAFALLLCSAALGLQYTGDQCVGFVDFELKDGTNIAALDATVQSNMRSWLIPMWLAQQCKVQFRRHYCVEVYGAQMEGTVSGLPPCASVCDDMMWECRNLFSYSDSFPVPLSTYFAILGLPPDCSAEPTTDCTTGGASYSYFDEDNAVCPTPLMYMDPHNTEDIWVSASFGGVADCSSRCPTGFYTYDKWQIQSILIEAFTWISFGGSIIILVTQLLLQKAQILSLVFVASCIGASLGMVVLIVNGHDDVYCKEDRFVENFEEVCVFQGICVIFFSICISMTVVCQAIDVFVRVVLGYKARWLKYSGLAYVGGIVAVGLVCVSPPIAGNNIGFDEYWQMGWCFFMFSNDESYFNQLFMVPQLITLSVCGLLVLLTIFKITTLLLRNVRQEQKSFANSVSDEKNASHSSTRPVEEVSLSSRTRSQRRTWKAAVEKTTVVMLWKKLLQYNVQTLIFIFSYCVLSASCILALQTFQSKYDAALETATEWSTCLLVATVTDPKKSAGVDSCGEEPDGLPALSLGGYVTIFYGAPGLFALLIYAPLLWSGVKALWEKRIATKQQPQRSQFLSTQVGASDRTQALPRWFRGRREEQRQQQIEQELELQENMSVDSAVMLQDEPMREDANARNAVAESKPAAADNGANQPNREFDEGDEIMVGAASVGIVSRFLGRGQFGSVFSVTVDQSSGRQLALKCARFPEGASETTVDVKAFCEEAHTSLHAGAHKNIVTLRYVCQDDSPNAPPNQFLLFYDLVDGWDLHTFLTAQRPAWLGGIRPSQAVQAQLFSLSYQLMDGLQWLHSQNVLHCDIKPDNVLVSKDGKHLRITDFGLARICKNVDNSGQPTCTFPGGTPAYRSPEIAANEGVRFHITPKTSDMWAAGLTILQIYCGGHSLWHQKFPKSSPGEAGVNAVPLYSAARKDMLFEVQTWAALEEQTRVLGNKAVNALNGTDVREFFCSIVHNDDKFAAHRKQYSIGVADVLKLRRADRLVSVMSMPLSLQQVLAATLSADVLHRPDSIREWKDQLLTSFHSFTDGLDRTAVVDEVPQVESAETKDLDTSSSETKEPDATPDEAGDVEPVSELGDSAFNSSSALPYDQCLQIVQLSDRQETLSVPVVDIATSLVNIAMALHQTKHHASARNAYLEALNVAPEVVGAAALYNLATSCYALNQQEDARMYFTKAIIADPTYKRAHYALSKFAREDNDLVHLHSLLSDCVALDQECELWKAHWRLGKVSRLLSRDANATVALYQNCIAHSTRCPEAYASLALEQYLAGNSEESLSNAQAAHGQNESSVLACYVLGLIYGDRGEDALHAKYFRLAEAASQDQCHLALADLFWAYGASDKLVMDAYMLAASKNPQDTVLKMHIEDLLAGRQVSPDSARLVKWISKHGQLHLLY